MSKAKKGKKRSVETREKISNEDGEEAQRGDQREDGQDEEGAEARKICQVAVMELVSIFPTGAKG